MALDSFEDPKFPEDFKGWIPLYTPLYPVLGGRYLVLESPDGDKEACIHLVDNEVVGIMDRATGMMLYEHPRNVLKISDLKRKT